MPSLRSKAQAAFWIAELREAQKQRSEQEASLALKQKDNAEEQRRSAEDESNAARAGWINSTKTGEVFDPQFAILWCREIDAKKELLDAAGSALEASNEHLRISRDSWATALQVQNRSVAEARRLSNAYARQREENAQFDMAEIRISRGSRV